MTASHSSDNKITGKRKAKSMELPREIMVGQDAIGRVGFVCRKLGLKGPAVLIADDVTRKVGGEPVIESMDTNNYEIFTKTIKDATIEEVEAVETMIEEHHTNFVLGVGGGRPIDAAKLASFNKKMPFISVPTAASHDGIVSSRASIWVGGKKQSYDSHTPFAVIADTNIIAQAPMKILAAGCGDLISNETAVKDWELAHKVKNEEISTYASTLSKMTAFVIEKYAEIISAGGSEAAWHVIKALVASGVAMSIAGSSRPCSGAEHMFSHRLDAITPKPALHGEQCAVGTIMMMKLHGGNWESTKATLEKIGTPTTASGLGIGSEYIIRALMEAHTVRPDRFTILGEGIDEKTAIEVATTTGVIE